MELVFPRWIHHKKDKSIVVETEAEFKGYEKLGYQIAPVVSIADRGEVLLDQIRLHQAELERLTALLEELNETDTNMDEEEDENVKIVDNKCPNCEFEAKSPFGLRAHMKKHKG
jgi:hypothetical protein